MCKIRLEIKQEQRRQHKQNAVEEDPSGGEDGMVPETVDFSRQHRIACPYKTGLSASLEPLKLMRAIPAMASTKPVKKFALNFSSPFINRCVSIAVKNGAMEMITPTLEACVQVSAMFSSK